MSRLSDLGEFEAIRLILAARAPGDGVAVGPGDDAAILRPADGMDLAATTDAFVEGVHYRPQDLTDLELGSRLAAANLSDLAGVAGRPRWGLISMGARPDTTVGALVDRDRGISAVLRAHDAVLVGGNLTAVTGPEWMSLTLIGECTRGRAWTRQGAQAGDLLAVTGAPGRAAAGLAMTIGRGRAAATDWWAPLFRAFVAPASRVDLAQRLAAIGAVRAAIDISDGLAADLGHLCAASGVGAELRESDWVEDDLLARAAAECGVDPASWRFGPSDDYELLLAIPPEAAADAAGTARAAGVALAVVGTFTPLASRIWVDRSGVPPRAHEQGLRPFSLAGC